jgi:hypothetical protein
MASTLVRQLYSRSVWIADGATTIWNFQFTGGYIDTTHIRAFVRNVTTNELEAVPFNVATDLIGPFQLQIVPAIPAGQEFTILRDTPKDLPIVDFQDGGRITETSLDTNAKQAVFIAAESIDAILVDQLGATATEDDWGYKSLKQEPYSGASTVSVIDNGRSHYKTDGTQVSVPDSLKVTFLTTIINDSTGDMTVLFPGGNAVLQGSGDSVGAASFVLGARSLLSLTKVAAGRWFISGNAS